jgi:Zn-dependent peptidase ImmA (M78 family)
MIDKVQVLIRRLASAGLPDASRKTAIDEAILQEGMAGSFERWTTAMVERLARAAGLDPAVVWAPGPLPEVPTARFLRGTWPDFNDADVPVLMAALEEASSLRAIAVDVLNVRRHFTDDDRAAVTGKPFEHGYRLAALVRSRLKIPTQPIRDIHELAAGLLHVHVVYRPLKTLRLHAVTLMSPDGAAAVVNTRTEGRDVMHRRTIAHELAHALFDPYEGNLFTVVDDELDEDIDGSPMECRARAFAAELLVPKAGLTESLGVPARTRMLDVAAEQVRTVAARFWAPPELVAYHLINRKYVDRSLKGRLIEAVRGTEPLVNDPYKDWLRVRTTEALEAELISSNRAKELLRLSVYDRDLVA